LSASALSAERVQQVDAEGFEVGRVAGDLDAGLNFTQGDGRQVQILVGDRFKPS
jgi:hypothetical protein